MRGEVRGACVECTLAGLIEGKQLQVVHAGGEQWVIPA